MRRQTIRTTRLSGDYKTYAEALAVCPKPAFADGRAAEALAESFRDRLPKASATFSLNADRSIRLMPYLTALSLCSGSPSVLDVGGDTGLFYRYLMLANPALQLDRYGVLEAPEIAAIGREFRASSGEGPHYFGDVSELGAAPYSLVVFGGVLQILPDPEAFMRRVLATAPSEYVLITTLPLIDQRHDRIAVKQIRAAHPYWLFGRRWRKTIAEIGEIVIQFEMPTFRFQVDGGEAQPQWGFIIRRR